MKHLLTICLLAAISLTATAQNHQTFKGVPIDGKTSHFINQLKQKGFQQIDDSISLTGTFAGYDDCLITVVSSAQTGNVYSVEVQIPIRGTSIYSEFKKLQTALTEKYGESVNRKYVPGEDDFFQALDKLLKGTFSFPYNYVFKTDCGSVTLDASWYYYQNDYGDLNMDRCIVITYIDNVNNTAHQQSIYDDL